MLDILQYFNNHFFGENVLIMTYFLQKFYEKHASTDKNNLSKKIILLILGWFDENYTEIKLKLVKNMHRFTKENVIQDHVIYGLLIYLDKLDILNSTFTVNTSNYYYK